MAVDEGEPADELYRWTNGRIVLFVTRDGAGATIARGWQEADGLVDVRRWRFDCERRLIGQMRRLVREATGDHRTADDQAVRFSEWLRRG